MLPERHQGNNRTLLIMLKLRASCRTNESASFRNTAMLDSISAPAVHA